MEMEAGGSTRRRVAASLAPLLSAPGRELAAARYPAAAAAAAASAVPDPRPASSQRRVRMGRGGVRDESDDLFPAPPLPPRPLTLAISAEEGSGDLDDGEPKDAGERAPLSPSSAAAAAAGGGRHAACGGGEDSDSESSGPSAPPAPRRSASRCCCRYPGGRAAGDARVRGCRDVPCLALLVLVWAAWIVLGWAVISYGCPDHCNDPRQMVRLNISGCGNVPTRTPPYSFTDHFVPRCS